MKGVIKRLYLAVDDENDRIVVLACSEIDSQLHHHDASAMHCQALSQPDCRSLVGHLSGCLRLKECTPLPERLNSEPDFYATCHGVLSTRGNGRLHLEQNKNKRGRRQIHSSATQKDGLAALNGSKAGVAFGFTVTDSRVSQLCGSFLQGDLQVLCCN